MLHGRRKAYTCILEDWKVSVTWDAGVVHYTLERRATYET